MARKPRVLLPGAVYPLPAPLRAATRRLAERGGAARFVGVNELERQLLDALIALEQAARASPTVEPRPSLFPLFERIETLAAELPPSADPELRHFLQRKSYEKARQWLEGAAAQRGTCGH